MSPANRLYVFFALDDRDDSREDLMNERKYSREDKEKKYQKKNQKISIDDEKFLNG